MAPRAAVGAIETLLPAFLSAARLLAIAAVLACLGVPGAAAAVAALQLAVTMVLRVSSHESVGGRAAFAAAAHAGGIAALLMLSAAYPIACSLACAAVYVSIYAGLARGAPPRTVDLSGQVVVVTGSSAGIGLETATSLLGLGATVVFATSNLDTCMVSYSPSSTISPPSPNGQGTLHVPPKHAGIWSESISASSLSMYLSSSSLSLSKFSAIHSLSALFPAILISRSATSLSFSNFSQASVNRLAV